MPLRRPCPAVVYYGRTRRTRALFQEEEIAARSTRLHGEVMLTSSVPAWLITGFVTGFAVGALTWAALASYARTEPVQGVVAPVVDRRPKRDPAWSC